MNASDIAFPYLGIYLENLPKRFSVFGFEIAFYSLIIGIGVLLGICLVTHEAKETNQNPDVYWDFAIYGILFSVIGARAYYVLFSWQNYKDDLLSIFHIRNGGMAIYGGVIAGVITLFVYAKRKRLNPVQMGDTAAPGLLLGQVIGRFGNFMNREAFGEYTDSLFAMRLPIAAVRHHEITDKMWEHVTTRINYIQVHPTFLYESLWNLGVLTIMLSYRRHKRFHGEVCLLYLGGYGLGRLWIEGLRTDQLRLPGTELAVSQALSLILVLFAVGADFVLRRGSKVGDFVENGEKSSKKE